MSHTAKKDKMPWRKAIRKYQKPDLRRSLWQLVNTLVPYVGLWFLMYHSLKISYWITLALAFPAAGLAARTFIIFHDCGHGSFFKSKKANRVVGAITGILLFTPYDNWRHNHAVHHATAGDLDRRDVGDVWTLTVDEFINAPASQRLAYRLIRHPLILFGIGAHLQFLVLQRLARTAAGQRERQSVYLTNWALLAIVVLMSLTIGFKEYWLIQLPIIMIAATAGVWLFYVQHQFEDVYWERHENWDYVQASLLGSSYYKLPKLLQWFSGNIGFHHIHHLSPRIPNYYLERCFEEIPEFKQPKTFTLLTSLKSLGLRLWDEQQGRLVGFKALKTIESSQ